MQYHVAEMATEDFATWFKRALTRRGWSQADFAKSAGIPHATVSAWYRGTRLPGPASSEIIAETLHVNRDEVLAVAGIRPVEHDDPEHIRELMGLLRRIAWTPDRLRFVRTVLLDLAAHTPTGGGSRIPSDLSEG